MIAWRMEDGQILCEDCASENTGGRPLTEDDFEDDVYVYCDKCKDHLIVEK